jgi:trk system potassium uptake protein
VGRRVGELELPGNTALIAVVRGDNVIVPQPDDVLAAGDEVLFIGDSSLGLSSKSRKGVEPAHRLPRSRVGRSGHGPHRR